MLGLVDSHCHLDFPPLAGDAPAVLGRARAAGVTDIIVPAYDVASWTRLEALAACRGGPPRLHFALGLHPWVAEAPFDRRSLERGLSKIGAVAVGEIGLDTQVAARPDRQREVLEAQLDLALDLDLPVLLHCRGAFEELLALVAARRGRLRGVVHAFSRGPQLARRFLDLGLHLAFGGAVTRPGAERARRAATIVPLDRMLLETDAPSIGLAGVPPEAAEPRHVAAVASCLAGMRGVSVELLVRQTSANAQGLFRWPVDEVSA